MFKKLNNLKGTEIIDVLIVMNIGICVLISLFGVLLSTVGEAVGLISLMDSFWYIKTFTISSMAVMLIGTYTLVVVKYFIHRNTLQPVES